MHKNPAAISSPCFSHRGDPDSQRNPGEPDKFFREFVGRKVKSATEGKAVAKV
jgi:hypothetical protein